MKRITTLFLLAMFAFSPLVKADEGMWLLMSIDKQTYKEMKKKGLKPQFALTVSGHLRL